MTRAAAFLLASLFALSAGGLAAFAWRDLSEHDGSRWCAPLLVVALVLLALAGLTMIAFAPGQP